MSKTASGGQIWKAKNIIIAIPNHKVGDNPRRVVVEKGEMVEFRYWSPATFRTADGLYLQLIEKEFYDNFEFVGDIFYDVAFRNQNQTKEIIEYNLYHRED